LRFVQANRSNDIDAVGKQYGCGRPSPSTHKPKARRARRESQPNRSRTTTRTTPSSHTAHNDPLADGTPGAKLSLAVLEDLKNRGFNQSEIADMFDVTRQYVSWIKYH
jgi:hypothetical protein